MDLNEYIGKVTTGDCLDLMRELPDNSIDSVITDPPYGLSNHSTEDVSECLACWIKGEPYTQSKKGFMGKAWDGWVPGPEVWKECYRVLKPGGTILCFAGSRTQDLMGMALRLSGFEISDAIVWNFGQGFPKSHNISKALDKQAGSAGEIEPLKRGWERLVSQAPNGVRNNNGLWGNESGRNPHTTLPSTELAKQFDGYGTALKPSYEIILMGRKPCDGTFAQNAEKWGLAGLNIDGGRIALEEGDDTKRVVGGHKTSYIGGTLDKNYPIELQANRDNGRWPANTILSCFCEDEANHDADCPVRIMDEQSDGASRFFYCAKPSRKEKEAGLEGFIPQERFQQGNYSQSPVCSVCNKTFNGTNNHDECGENTMVYKSKEENKVSKNIHPTCKPVSLMRYLCKLTRPPHGGIVLDPFTGSGTTGIAAILEDRDFIGFELSQEYADIANARIEHHRKLNIKDYDEEL